MDLSRLTTENRNQKTMNLDELPVHDVLQLMNTEDHGVPEGVQKALPQIEAAVKASSIASKKMAVSFIWALVPVAAWAS